MMFEWKDLEIAATYLGNRVPGSAGRGDLLTDAGEASLADCLNARLMEMYRPLLWEAMRPAIEREMPLALSLPEMLPEDLRDRLERDAFDRLLRGGREKLWAEYPELQRQETIVREGFVRFIDAFLARYASKGSEMGAALLGNRAPGKITALRNTGTETRPHARMTLRVETEGGTLYYKPRTCRAEAFYVDLTATFFPRECLAARVVSGENDAFMANVTPAPLADEAELQTYYYNLGIVTAVCYVLRSGDMHFYNFIAHGVHPVPVDLEYILTARNTPPRARRLSETGILSSDGQDPLFSVLYAEALLRLKPEARFVQPHLPELQGVPRGVYEAEAEYLRGFENGCRAIMDRRAQWRDFLRAHADLPVRMNLRASMNYEMIFHRLHSPSILKSFEARDRFLEALWGVVERDEDRRLMRAIEEEPLRNLDYPDIHLRAGDGHIYDHTGNIVVRDWRKSPLSCALESLDALSEAETENAVSEIQRDIERARSLTGRRS